MGNKMAGFWGRAAGGFNQGTQVQVHTSILSQRFGASHGTVQEASASLPPHLNVSLLLCKAVFLLVGLCVPPTSALKCQLNPVMLHARDAQWRHVRPLPGLCREVAQTTVPMQPRTSGPGLCSDPQQENSEVRKLTSQDGLLAISLPACRSTCTWS